MNTVIINFTTTDPQLVFTGVTTYKHDKVNNVFSIVHDGGNFDEQLENVSDIYIN